MRRKDREITDFEQMRAILDACDCARLGLVDEQGAYIVPMNFGWEEQDGKLALYFHGAAEGKKLDLIRKQGSVSFEMDRKHELVEGDIACAYSYCYQSIMGNGRIKIVEDIEQKKHGLQVIMSHYTKKQNWDFQDELVNRVAVLKLEVDNWSCKEH
ncbi:pyridoxamine 5'-phosphate oxidase family protein [Roseburia sp. MUC/MUC-530-WT-4D]|uniref:Pyridoxamine 5'-phosphate oxidase family protein n=1 Tax=Roseburia porci TaxID=2605790 RepID=A0A6L5YVP2_9FIRM|nr:pyridoxamine 5'-phosphate oxidase family protein [Roseburia porci]MCI5517752.1 pyridoxamine 5'-phosphate oxidase family protein [Roseburia sp.]MDD6744235.1 pyridoxamine 5'-phosphate oxidase family protein [Roseburia porci]MST76039.1 pyridoxamine 5'-phosphate oxidase family protein [Roseburia porci]